LRISELLQTMNKLPMDQRRAVVLCGYYGLDYEAAALHEKVHVGTIRSRLARGREELRKLYEGTTSEGWLLELIERWGRAPSRRIVEHEEENA
jgi:DNA-directed RNA polymerase specialized sigma24 family protein